MKAVILAAGRGTRLMPLTKDIPKAMVNVNGKPLLEIIIGQLKVVDIMEIVIIVHHLKEKIINYFGDGSKYGVKITYEEQEEMLGTAHALCQAQPHVTEKFLCIAADSLFPTKLLRKVMAHSSQGVCTAKVVENPAQFGVFEVKGSKIVKLIEKPQYPVSNLANFSVYQFPVNIFDYCATLSVSSRGEFELTDAIQQLIDQGFTFEVEVTSQILDIGKPEHLEQAQELAKELGL